MSFKEIEAKHIKIKSWKDRIMWSMQKSAQNMGRCKWIMLMFMALFLLLYHSVFRICISISEFFNAPKTGFRKLCRNEVFQEIAMYAGTALMFLGVYIIGIKFPDPITFDWGKKTAVASIAVEHIDSPQIVSDYGDVANAPQSIDPEVSETYKAMRGINPDFDAWIRIDGTDIDYPVMYTPDEPERYLHKDFYGVDSFDGLPFIDARCNDFSDCSDNTIIYGHNMKDGSMFGNLTDYESPDYCKEHPIIRVDTSLGEADYEIMSVFYDRVYYADEDVFKFYNFIDANDEKSYDDAVQQYMEKSLYDTGVKAEYGDKLITLVTCTYQVENGRFVVVAKRIPGTNDYGQL